MTIRRVCSYCKSVMGEIEADHDGVTHGICPACEYLFTLEWKRRVDLKTVPLLGDGRIGAMSFTSFYTGGAQDVARIQAA